MINLLRRSHTDEAVYIVTPFILWLMFIIDHYTFDLRVFHIRFDDRAIYEVIWCQTYPEFRYSTVNNKISLPQGIRFLLKDDTKKTHTMHTMSSLE